MQPGHLEPQTGPPIRPGQHRAVLHKMAVTDVLPKCVAARCCQDVQHSMHHSIWGPTASQHLAGPSDNRILTPSLQRLGQVNSTVYSITTAATSPTSCVHAGCGCQTSQIETQTTLLEQWGQQPPTIQATHNNNSSNQIGWCTTNVQPQCPSYIRHAVQLCQGSTRSCSKMLAHALYAAGCRTAS